MKRKKNERIGQLSKNKQGLTMQILKYYCNKNVIVTFLETGETVRCRYGQFVKGDVKATKEPIGNKQIVYGAFAVAAVTLLLFGIKILF